MYVPSFWLLVDLIGTPNDQLAALLGHPGPRAPPGALARLVLAPAGLKLRPPAA